MKPFIILTGVAATLALAGCSEPAETGEAVEPTAAVETEETAMAIDGQPVAGTYTVTEEDGTSVTVELTDAGEAIYTLPDGTVRNATYTGATGTDPYCVTFEDKETCWSQTIVDGVWTAAAVDDPEDTTTITRVPAE